jgi:MFS family permease
MDTAGATLGLALAAVIIYSMEGTALELTRQSFQRLVLIGVIPAVLGVIVLLLFVHEKRESRERKAAGRATPAPVRSPLDARFKLYLVILGLFTLGRGASDFFVILRAQNLDVPLVQVTLMLVVMNGAYALMSLPMGVVSDKLGRRRIIATGWFIYALVYLGFALATHLWQAWLLFAGFGIYQGVVEGVGRAFVADLVPEGRRGTGYGLQQGVTGLLVLPAGVIAGFLWDRIAPAAPFYLGAGLAFVAMVGILTLIREPKGIAAK